MAVPPVPDHVQEGAPWHRPRLGCYRVTAHGTRASGSQSVVYLVGSIHAVVLHIASYPCSISSQRN
jgi:hypothetical protein